MSKTFQQEKDDELNFIYQEQMQQVCKNRGSIELFITPKCNQKCTYCYLVKYGEYLYPQDICDEVKIINNLKLYLQHLEENFQNLQTLSLFSGEIWGTSFGDKILDVIYDFCKRGKFYIHVISIPSNFSFILNEKAKLKIQEYINKFLKLNVQLSFSCSVDGELIDAVNRPLSNGMPKYTEQFYEKVFDFCKKNRFGFHPMVNSESIELWGDQFKWWIDKLIEYDLDVFNYIMFFDVRNDTWTDDKINNYLKYLNESADYLIDKIFFGDVNQFLRWSILVKNHLGKYSPLVYGQNTNGMSCIVDRSICIRLGDLSWGACHRTFYDNLIFGKFNVQNGHITTLESHNVEASVAVLYSNFKSHPVCDCCPIATVCTRGCYGAQLESNKDMFFPCTTVCNLYKAKYLFMTYKIQKLIKEYKINDEELLQRFYQCSKLINNLEEEVKKWEPQIQLILSN